MDLRTALLSFHQACRRERIDHALIGGLALAAHGAPRATADLDFLADGARCEDLDRVLCDAGYEALHRSENAANYAASDPARGRIDLLFARHAYGRAMLARAPHQPVLGTALKVVDAADLIGLKVQSSSNDPSRRRRDLADIEALLRTGDVDLHRAREYFRLFDREKELDSLLADREAT